METIPGNDWPATAQHARLEVRVENRIDPRLRILLTSVRQGLIICVGAIEEYLYLERTFVPKRKR